MPPAGRPVGSTEPVLPGVAIGHNGRVAWGLTIVGTDQSDVYVEQLNPDNPNQVRWRDGWESLREVVDTILVKGGEPEVVELKYSRHGPIFYEDREPPGLRPPLHHARTWLDWLSGGPPPERGGQLPGIPGGAALSGRRRPRT